MRKTVCDQCGEVLPKGRQRFCSTRCSRRFHGPKTRARRAVAKGIEKEIGQLVRKLHQARWAAYNGGHYGKLLDWELSYRWESWGSSPKAGRDYGLWVWRENASGRVPE